MKDNVIVNYIRNSIQELTKVTWPTKNQAVKLTIIVFIFCIFSAVLFGLIDLLFNEGYSFLISKFV